MSTLTTELPKISSKGLNTLLGGLKKEDGTPLVTEEQVEQLIDLKFKSGQPILSLEERWFIYEIVWLLNVSGFDLTYNYLSTDWEKVFGPHNIRKKMLFENPLMSSAKEKAAIDMEIFRTKIDVEMGEPCRRCKSTSTIAFEKQTRSADEAMTIKISCLSCSYKWTAQ